MRLGTRGSALALAQAQRVAERLGGAEIRTTAQLAAEAGWEAGAGEDGAATGDKSRWVRHLERALLEGAIDLAVHSAKDLPGELPTGLALLGAPARGAAGDVLVGAAGLESLPAGARVGTSSLRREAQLSAAREDLAVVPLAGNVDTRLRKLSEGAERLDAVVLAGAGLDRLGLDPRPRASLDPARFVPAPGQGVIALEGRAGDEPARAAAAEISDAGTVACLAAERSLARALEASCNTPIGAHATLPGAAGEAGSGSASTGLRLRAWIGLPDGSAWIGDELAGAGIAEAEQLGIAVAERMRAAGAGDMLREAEGMVLERA